MRMPFMQRAFDLARQAAGGVSPRPPVGAVIVREGRIVGEGHTDARPGPHAEVAALTAARGHALGATMYVTLEPHAHQGVALPCTEAILAAGISRVVCPIEDPNPLVSGNGFRQLRSNRVDVVVGGSPDELRTATELVEGFRKWVTTRRPFVIAKFAISLDGKIATRTGDSQWISGELSRQYAHRLRAASDAVMVGIGTVLKDDPLLTARGDGAPPGRPKLRVVIDTRGRMPANARLLSESGNILWLRGDGATTKIGRPGLEAVDLSVRDGKVDLEAVMGLLGQREVCNVMVEGGGTLLGAMFDYHLIDKIEAFVAPVLVGGTSSPGPIGGEGVEKVADALRLDRVRMTPLGEDMLVRGYVKK